MITRNFKQKDNQAVTLNIWYFLKNLIKMSIADPYHLAEILLIKPQFNIATVRSENREEICQLIHNKEVNKLNKKSNSKWRKKGRSKTK